MTEHLDDIELRRDTTRTWVISLAPSLLYLAAAVIGAGVVTDQLPAGIWIFVGLACAAGGTLLMQRPPSRLKSGAGFAWNVTYLHRRNARLAAGGAAGLQALAAGVFLWGGLVAFL